MMAYGNHQRSHDSALTLGQHLGEPGLGSVEFLQLPSARDSSTGNVVAAGGSSGSRGQRERSRTSSVKRQASRVKSPFLDVKGQVSLFACTCFSFRERETLPVLSAAS